MTNSIASDTQALVGLAVLVVLLTAAIVVARRIAKQHADPPERIRPYLREQPDEHGSDDDNRPPSTQC
jgi:hypothetical protein